MHSVSPVFVIYPSFLKWLQTWAFFFLTFGLLKKKKIQAEKLLFFIDLTQTSCKAKH